MKAPRKPHNIALALYEATREHATEEIPFPPRDGEAPIADFVKSLPAGQTEGSDCFLACSLSTPVLRVCSCLRKSFPPEPST